MKSLKMFSVLVAISFATFIVYSCAKETEKQLSSEQSRIATPRGGEKDLIDLLGTACVPDNIIFPGVCNDTLFIDTLIVNDLPQYPGCKFKVIFNRRECKDGTLVDITVGDFQILEHDCPQFSEDCDSKWAQSVWSDFIIDFETSMWSKIQDYLISQNVTEDKFICGQGKYFSINFIRASCYRYASVIQKKSGLGICTKLTCGSQCCERHTAVCRNADGTLNVTTNDVTNPFAINCGDPAFQIDPPVWLGKVEWISECTVTCPD